MCPVQLPVDNLRPPGRRFVYIWEFEVVPGAEARFLEYYGPAGAWSKLFARAEGYVGTLLLNDQAHPNRYLTVDRWTSDLAFASFLARFGAEYEALDRACASLASHEASLGSYWEASDGRPAA